MSGYLTVSMLLLGGPAGVRPDDMDAADEALARSAKEALTNWESGRFENLTAKLGSDAVSDHVKRAVERIIETNERREIARLSSLPLEVSRVREFRQEATGLLAEHRAKGLGSLVRQVSRPEQQDLLLLGFNTLVPRWWFVEEGRVHAPPKQLARELVGGLIRGEEERILSSLLEAVPHRSISDASRLARRYREWRRQSHSVPARRIMTNSWEAYEILSRGKDREAVGGELEMPDGARLSRVYDDRDPFVVAFSSQLSLQVLSFPPKLTFPSDSLLDSGVLIGVRDIEKEELRELSVKMSKSESELTGQAVVRLLEGFAVDIVDRESIRVWSLPSVVSP